MAKRKSIYKELFRESYDERYNKPNTKKKEVPFSSFDKKWSKTARIASIKILKRHAYNETHEHFFFSEFF